MGAKSLVLSTLTPLPYADVISIEKKPAKFLQLILFLGVPYLAERSPRNRDHP
jgi:hypothetical protein